MSPAPTVSTAASMVKDRMGLSAGPVLDELIEAAEQAATVDDLPQWARNVLAVTPLTTETPTKPAVVDDGAPNVVDYTPMTEEQREWVEFGERMLPNDFTITAPAA